MRLGIRRRVSAVVLLLAATSVAFTSTSSGHAAVPGHGASILAGDAPPVITGKGHQP